MIRTTSIRVAAVGILAAALVAGSATAALAATEPVATVGSKGALYAASGADGSIIPKATQLGFEDPVIARPDTVDLNATFPGSADTTMAKTFVAPRGQENDPSKWVAWTDTYLDDNANMYLPVLSLGNQTSGNLSTVKAGGDFSLGFAFMKNNGLTVSDGGAYFTFINVDNGGTWTFATPSDVVVPPVEGGEFDVELNADVVDGGPQVLTLSNPASTSATIGNAAMVDGKSTSTGTLGAFTVTDTRYSTHPGWTLTSMVTEFTKNDDATKKIGAQQLGLAPKIAAANPNVVVSDPQVAGTGVYPSVFAQANPDKPAAGAVSFDADLKFVAPVGSAVGTYTSKLTLTLVSK
ncbi:hypothetical protein N1028_11120 [Herbiconiux sp. CPCC 203407]|uniref:WxL domain-containing protein n=1 Tax=Herbiconiux oxytropis TaxID=2970915 RepID=A0AA42BWK8_9MICO|nr:hypothetical protein [Herbiconiux oxytropis]MCS5723524.1 hypothetical protein [Herbiconiux oxytropis]MCS5726443.1 hypothetical protein [Herbiconiux oxytropis]